jgi:hypothetical protein
MKEIAKEQKSLSLPRTLSLLNVTHCTLPLLHPLCLNLERGEEEEVEEEAKAVNEEQKQEREMWKKEEEVDQVKDVWEEGGRRKEGRMCGGRCVSSCGFCIIQQKCRKRLNNYRNKPISEADPRCHALTHAIESKRIQGA